MTIECTVKDFFLNCPCSGYSGLITAVYNGEQISVYVATESDERFTTLKERIRTGMRIAAAGKDGVAMSLWGDRFLIAYEIEAISPDGKRERIY